MNEDTKYALEIQKEGRGAFESRERILKFMGNFSHVTTSHNDTNITNII